MLGINIQIIGLIVMVLVAGIYARDGASTELGYVALSGYILGIIGLVITAITS